MEGNAYDKWVGKKVLEKKGKGKARGETCHQSKTGGVKRKHEKKKSGMGFHRQ